MKNRETSNDTGIVSDS